MDFGTNLYIRKDAGAAFLGADVPLPSITLVVDGPTTIAPFYMVLPTEGRDRVSVYLVWGWMAALSSPMVEATDMTAAQRTLLLTIACAYSAFLDLQPGVRAEDFEEMTRRLRDLAHKLQPLTPAESELQTLKQWLEARLPASAFAPMYDDDFVIPDPVASSEPRQKDLVANLVAMLNPAIVDSVANVAAQTSSSTTPSPPSASRARKDRRRRAKQRAASGAASSPLGPLPASAVGAPESILPPEEVAPEADASGPAGHAVPTTPLVVSIPTPNNSIPTTSAPDGAIICAPALTACVPAPMLDASAIVVEPSVPVLDASVPAHVAASIAVPALDSTGPVASVSVSILPPVLDASAVVLGSSVPALSASVPALDASVHAHVAASLAVPALDSTVPDINVFAPVLDAGVATSEEEDLSDSDSEPPSLRTVTGSSDSEDLGSESEDSDSSSGEEYE